MLHSLKIDFYCEMLKPKSMYAFDQKLRYCKTSVKNRIKLISFEAI